MLRFHTVSSVALLAALLLFGCNTKSHIGGDDAGADGGDVDTGTRGEPCGPSVCSAGEVCCNESCGICTPPDGSCIDLWCGPVDPPPPADGGSGGEPCGAVICGEGTVCCNASCGICTSPGETCAAIACADVGPPVVSCGGFAGDTCAPDEFCDFPDGAFCGAADETGVCTPRPGPACIEIYSPVCGCDGVTYDNSCFAQAAGTDYSASGTCDSTDGGGAP